MFLTIVMVSALVKVAIMSELSAQAARPRPSRAATSPLPFAEQIGPPSLRARRAITPTPTGRFLIKKGCFICF
ncbi:unnamed protein product [Angiostrongylus costaricensis]|uniref:Secreted protein n=1 Tax=Angiostrongylus costaricensis TaxID=334426 RepID=A0A0R3Q175_ANGCS|nr:unnamed protein product [Angiostrongylus costaricensis]